MAADRILDAADELFTQQEAATVGMHEIASAAGCSRATLYRYFENREALYTAYVHRESYRLYREMIEQINSVDDPRERLIEGMLASLRNVRESPALASWFATTQRPIGAEMAEQSEVIKALAEAFVVSLGPDDPDGVAPGPLAGAGDDLAADVPRPRRCRRAGDARGVRRADRATEPSGHPIGLRLNRFARDPEVVAEDLGHRPGGSVVACHPAEVVAASNADELTASTKRLPAVLAVHPHHVGAARHGKLLVVVVPGLQEHLGRGCRRSRSAAS